MDLNLLPPFALPLFYLDPGSGSLLIQLLLAFGLGIGVAVKLYWNKLKSLFTGKKNNDQQLSEDDKD